MQAILAASPFVYTRFADSNGIPYIALMNNSQSLPSNAIIRLNARVQSLKRVGWDGVLETAQTGQRYAEFSEFGKWFAPGQLELYQVIILSSDNSSS